jgi:hypothetical protein
VRRHEFLHDLKREQVFCKVFHLPMTDLSKHLNIFVI